MDLKKILSSETKSTCKSPLYPNCASQEQLDTRQYRCNQLYPETK